MNKTILKVYTSAIAEAALSRSNALEIELAVGFAVILECGPKSKRLARETLLTIYANAGSKCSEPGDIDWKAINRRIGATVALFDFIGVRDVAEWAGENIKVELIDALREHITPMKFKSVNEILLACGKVRAPRKGREVPVGSHMIDTPHVHIVVPPAATKAELIEAATQLMMLAQSMPDTFAQPVHAAPADHEAMAGEPA